MVAAEPKLLVEQQEDILFLTLNSPSKANALSPDLVEDLADSLDAANDVRLCVIRANGKHFCAGFDLADIQDLSDGDLLWRFLRIEMLLQKIHNSPFPIAAMAHGQVIGAGADLFGACWKRIATGDAKFRMPGWNFELALGTRRLRQLVGGPVARDLLIDTRSVAAPQAAQIGLVTDIVEKDGWPDLVDGLASRCRSLPAFATREMLRLTRDNTDDQDLASIVRTAGRPGLKERILAYRTTVERQAKERRAAAKGE